MENKKDDERYPEGHFIGLWIALGIAIFSGVGIPLSFALKNPGLIGIGPAIGVAFGVAIGSSIEAKRKEEGKIRPRTKKEQSIRKSLIIAAIALTIVGIALLLALLLK